MKKRSCEFYQFGKFPDIEFHYLFFCLFQRNSWWWDWVLVSCIPEQFNDCQNNKLSTIVDKKVSIFISINFPHKMFFYLCLDIQAIYWLCRWIFLLPVGKKSYLQFSAINDENRNTWKVGFLYLTSAPLLLHIISKILSGCSVTNDCCNSRKVPAGNGQNCESLGVPE